MNEDIRTECGQEFGGQGTNDAPLIIANSFSRKPIKQTSSRRIAKVDFSEYALNGSPSKFREVGVDQINYSRD